MADRRPLLMLIDGPSLVYRGYFALPPLTLSDGTLVNAVFGFLQIVLRGMQDVKPDYAIVSASTSASRSSASTRIPTTSAAGRACRTTCARSSRSSARSPR